LLYFFKARTFLLLRRFLLFTFVSEKADPFSEKVLFCLSVVSSCDFVEGLWLFRFFPCVFFCVFVFLFFAPLVVSEVMFPLAIYERFCNGLRPVVSMKFPFSLVEKKVPPYWPLSHPTGRTLLYESLLGETASGRINPIFSAPFSLRAHASFLFPMPGTDFLPF